MKHLLLIFVYLCSFSISSLGQTQKLPLLLGEKFILTSEILNQDREILVRLPNGYTAGKDSYEVHFILDGEITFKAYTGVVDIMVAAELIPDVIVVGIPNVDRRFDLNPRQNGGKFLEFITRELIPLIDSEYRTKSERLIAGYSMAGNYAIYAFLKGHDSFDKFLSGSPYRLDLYDENQISLLPDAFQSPKAVYTSIGKEDMQEQVQTFMDFCKMLESKSMDGFTFRHELIDGRNHDTNILPNWQDGLAFLYSNLKPNP